MYGRERMCELERGGMGGGGGVCMEERGVMREGGCERERGEEECVWKRGDV